MSQPFDSYAELREAALQVVAAARLRLDIFDVDGRDLGLGLSDFVEKIESFLVHPDARLRIAVHDTAHIERDCARLLQRLRFHSHQVAIHRTRPEAATAHDTLIIADSKKLLRRYHTDYARGQLDVDGDGQISPWLQRFEAVWEASESAVSFTTLGL